MKAIMISIKPKWVAKILNGEKTIEIRKSMPKCDLPIGVYIYCTKSNYFGYISKRYIGKVVAKFTLNKVEEIMFNDKEVQRKACLTEAELFDYLFVRKPYHEDMKKGYAWRISKLKIFNGPKELSKFRKYSGIPHNTCDEIVKQFRRIFQDYTIPFINQMKRPPQSWCYIESEQLL